MLTIQNRPSSVAQTLACTGVLANFLFSLSLSFFPSYLDYTYRVPPSSSLTAFVSLSFRPLYFFLSYTTTDSLYNTWQKFCLLLINAQQRTGTLILTFI